MKKNNPYKIWLTILTFLAPFVLLSAMVIESFLATTVALIPYSMMLWYQGRHKGHLVGFKKGYFHGLRVDKPIKPKRSTTTEPENNVPDVL